MLSEDIIKRKGKIIPNKNPLSLEIRKSIFMLMATLLIIIIMVSIVYLLNSSQSSQKGYILKQNQIRKDQLINDNRLWINKIIEVKSYDTIEVNDLIKDMIKPDNITYIKEEESENILE